MTLPSLVRALRTVSCVLAIFVQYAHISTAEEPENSLGLNEVLTSVDRNFPLLRAAEQERDVAKGAMLSSQGGFDFAWKTRATLVPVGYYESTRIESVVEKPTSIWGASAFAGYRLGLGDFAVYDGGLQTLKYGELRAGLNVPLWRNGPIDARRAERAKAEVGIDLAGLSLTQQRIEFRRQAAQRYWAWVAAGMRREVARTLLGNVQARDRGLTVRVERGDLADIERMDNARAIEQRKAQLSNAERSLEQAANELSLLLRDDSGKTMRLSADRLPSRLPEPTLVVEAEGQLRADLDRAQAARPEAKRLARQSEQAKVDLTLAENQMRPGIDLQLAASKDIGPAVERRPDLGPAVVYASLLLDVPLQTRVARGRRDGARASLARLSEQQHYARDRIEADVRNAHIAVRASRERIDAARAETLLAKQLERAERTRFEQGDSHLLIVNLREQQTAEAELREVDAIFDYHSARADLDAARGN